MNPDNIVLVKVGKHINIHDNKMKKFIYNMDLITPFGTEESNHVYYCNWIINGKNLNLILEIENIMEKYMREKYDIGDNWIWKSNIRSNDRFKYLLRTTHKSDYEFTINYINNVDVMVNCIWLHKITKTFGIQFVV